MDKYWFRFISSIIMISVGGLVFYGSRPFIGGTHAGFLSLLTAFIACLVYLYLNERHTMEPSEWIGPGIIAAVVIGALIYAWYQGAQT